MLAVQGIYKDGVVEIDKKMPFALESFQDIKVLVVFPEIGINSSKDITRAEAFERLKKYRRNGNDIDYEKEKDEYLREKYGNID